MHGIKKGGSNITEIFDKETRKEGNVMENKIKKISQKEKKMEKVEE